MRDDSTAFRSSKLHDLVTPSSLPEYAIIAADDAYQNSSHILTHYSGRRLSQCQESFNYYLSSCRIAVEQASLSPSLEFSSLPYDSVYKRPL